LDLKKLETLLGSNQVTHKENNKKYKLQRACFNPTPLPIVYVKSIEELAEVLRLATLENYGVIPVSGGTKLRLGNFPRKADFFLSLEKMNNIIEHEAADLTTTVEAGCNFGDFQNSLGKLGQYLPLNPPFADSASLGGIIATNSYGSMRLSNGTIRDWLIGIKVVNSNGEISKAGGKVVKNVAGYDLMKLYSGSLGTLSIIAQASFKLRPKPVKKSLVLGIFTFSSLYKGSRALLDSKLQANSLELLNSIAAKTCFPDLKIKKDEWLLIAEFAGSPQAINYQQQATKDFWANLSENILFVSETDSFYQGWHKVVDFNKSYTSQTSFSASTLPSKSIDLVFQIDRTLSTVVGDFALLAHVGNGVVRAFLREVDSITNSDVFDFENPKYIKLVSLVSSLRKSCENSGGFLVLEDDFFYKKLDTFGTPPKSFALMKTIKEKLDPLGVLNPGRFVGGL
jgi:glycolate oxidase FAD binding subunit